MKRLLQRRVLPLLCCLSLTVGLFSYQPPKAKALLTEASLATSVIWTFMQSAGLSFSGNNAGSQAWIDSCQRWYNKFMETKADAANGFVGWLGYDSWVELLKDIKYQQNSAPSLGYKLFIPKAISSKLAEFTQWFIGELGLTSGGESKPVFSDSCPVPRSIIDSFISDVSRNYDVVSNGWTFPFFYYGFYTLGKKTLYYLACSEKKGEWVLDGSYYKVDDVGISYSAFVYSDGTYNSNVGLKNIYLSAANTQSVGYFSSSPAGNIVATVPGAIDIPVDDTGDKATVVTIPGLDGEFSTIEGLLQKILDKLAANELKATGSIADTDTPDVPATDVGWKGTIEKIYNAIIDLPGRIAEAIKDLFIPHEGYATEFVSGINGIFEDRMGLLTYPLSVLSDFVGTVATLDEQEPILRWNDVVWQNKTIIQKGEYNLKSALSGTAMQSVYSVYRTVVSAVLVIAFLHLLLKKLKEVQSN